MINFEQYAVNMFCLDGHVLIEECQLAVNSVH